MKALMRLAGALLLVVGLIPLTPLIWLLVFVRGDPGGVFSHIHLRFWQTQAIGVVLVGLGVLLIRRAGRKP